MYEIIKKKGPTKGNLIGPIGARFRSSILLEITILFARHSSSISACESIVVNLYRPKCANAQHTATHIAIRIRLRASLQLAYQRHTISTLTFALTQTHTHDGVRSTDCGNCCARPEYIHKRSLEHTTPTTLHERDGAHQTSHSVTQRKVRKSSQCRYTAGLRNADQVFEYVWSAGTDCVSSCSK